MNEFVARRRIGLEFSAFGAVSGLLRFGYVRMNQILGARGESGYEFTHRWMVVASVYLVADLAVFAGMCMLRRVRFNQLRPSRALFVRDTLTILPSVLSLHLYLLLLEQPVSAKLESIGLGGLEGIAAGAATVIILSSGALLAGLPRSE